MKPFLEDDFLLESEPASKLYHDYAKKMPVLDYHCHVNPQHIAQDLRYHSITDVWLGGDHYKWRLMRANGVPESELTGSLSTDPRRVFEHFAAALPKAVGNPVYHWSHLELKRYFGVEQPLTPATAEEIYQTCNRVLAQPDMSVRGLIQRSNVRLICTTDDPVDDLSWHQKLREDRVFQVQVIPALRPDKAMNIDTGGFRDYIAQLGRCVGSEITTFAQLCAALDHRIDYFHSYGCRASDHALERMVCADTDPSTVNSVFQKAINGGAVPAEEAAQYRTALLLHLAKRYRELDWVMQIHFGCIRNLNSELYATLGPDTGFDAIIGDSHPDLLAPLLDRMHSGNALPKMILYSLNHGDNEVINTIAGCFMANAGCPGKIQLGSAWWFNDTKSGMEKQLRDLANGGLLGNFIGMLTDSRSFLSYTRHEYFRRILCNFIGDLVERGEYPADYAVLGKMVQDISYNNAVRYFGFDLPIEP